MAGRNIENFIPYINVTDKMVMSGPDAFVNDSTNYHGYTWAQAWSLRKNIQATAKIKDFIILTKERRAGFINANHRFEPKANASVQQYETGWATLANDNAFTDEEIEFNEANAKAQYKNLYKTYVIPMHTDTADKMEEAMWADPNDLMESPGAGDIRIPYSIPSLITPSGTASTAFTTAATKLGLSPVTYTNFKNYDVTFDDFSAQIERRLFRAKQHTDFRPPQGASSGSFSGTPLDRRVIYTDLKSLEDLRQILRDSNDRLAELGEFDGMLTYNRTPIVWAEPLGDSDTAATDQRLFGVNFDFLYPIVHNDYFMKVLNAPYGGPWKPHDMPLSNAIYEITRYNWWPRSLRRQFVIRHSSKTW
jgi:hypothetical protein